MLDDPLRYHGDQAAHGADLDFAVNVHGTTPQWYDYEDVFMAQQMGRLPYYNYTHTAGVEGRRLAVVIELPDPAAPDARRRDDRAAAHRRGKPPAAAGSP